MPKRGFNNVPKVFVGEFVTVQKASDLIMAQVGNEAGKSRRGGLSERGDEVIRIQVKQSGVADSHWLRALYQSPTA